MVIKPVPTFFNIIGTLLGFGLGKFNGCADARLYDPNEGASTPFGLGNNLGKWKNQRH